MNEPNLYSQQWQDYIPLVPCAKYSSNLVVNLFLEYSSFSHYVTTII